MKKVLTIAGSDSSGGAGIQADIKTMTALGVYAMSAITALTAQNTLGVKSISEPGADFLKDQIDAVFEDIRPDAVKIGMVSSSEIVYTIADRLAYYSAKNIVTDPVMVATSGSALIKSETVNTLCKKLLPMSALVTPNIPEAEVIAGIKIKSNDDMRLAAKQIGDTYATAVLVKAGHCTAGADDLLYINGTYKWFEGKRINNPNTHGTGCTLSSAIAAYLAKGFDIEKSIQLAKEYISGALASMLDIGSGSGPLNHAYMLNKTFLEK